MRISSLNPLRLGSWTLSTLFFLSFLACSKSDRTDMILMNIDLTEVPTTKSMTIAVKDAATQALINAQVVATPMLSGGIAKIALAQTAGMSGSVFMQVTAVDGDGAVLGDGTSQAAPVSPGKNVGPLAVKVKKTVVTPDGGGPGTTDAGAPDSVVPDTGTQLDVQNASPDTRLDASSDSVSTTKLDLLPGLPDAQDDVTIKTDIATATDGSSDTSLDAPMPDSASVQADSPAGTTDAPVDALPGTAADTGRDGEANILSTLNSCKKYVHYPNSPSTCAPGSNQESVYVSTTAFTPDAKCLVTAANNSWVKLWKVVDTGLEDTQIIFVGDGFKMTATISPAGDILAVGNPSGNVDLYDLNAAINDGTTSKIGTLLVNNLSGSAYGDYNRAFFTSDGKQVVVIYPTESTLSKGMVAVWDVATRLPVREFDYDFPNSPLTVTNSPSTGPIWAALGATTTVETDGGSHDQTTMTLVDVSGSSTVKPTFVVPGKVYRATFSPDNLTLAIGNYEGEVSLWDLSNKSNIQRLGSPLVEAGSSRDTVYGLAYSPDTQFLGVGSYSGASTMRLINLKTRGVTQRVIDYEPWSFGFAPDGTTWAYGVGGCGFVYFCRN